MYRGYSFIITILLQISLISLVNAQSYSITGNIIDAQNNTPLIGATVAVSNITDSIVRQVTFSEDKGVFVLNDLRKQSYKLKVLFVGYKRIEKIVVIKNALENIGRIEMQPETERIKDVVVIGQALPQFRKAILPKWLLMPIKLLKMPAQRNWFRKCRLCQLIIQGL